MSSHRNTSYRVKSPFINTNFYFYFLDSNMGKSFVRRFSCWKTYLLGVKGSRQRVSLIGSPLSKTMKTAFNWTSKLWVGEGGHGGLLLTVS